MAIDFSTIKSLTIPEGSVIKITDSNGVILYNQTAYRELEYIHFSGAEYINMGLQPTNATEFGLQVRFPSALNTTAYNGKGYMGVRNRYAIGYNNGTYFFGLGNWVSTSIQCDNNWHELRIRPNGFTTNVGYYIDGT